MAEDQSSFLDAELQVTPLPSTTFTFFPLLL